MKATSSRNRILASWIVWGFSAVWAMGLVAFAYMPTYSTSFGTDGGEVSSGANSLVEVNGGDGAFNLAAILTIGVLIVPVTSALVGACATVTPRPHTGFGAV